MKVTIIYHKIDLDGVASAAIAKSYYENQDCTTQIALCPYTYGDSMDEFKKEAEDSQAICVLDVSFGKDTLPIMKDWLERDKGVLWIDHHKGILEESESWPIYISGKREIGTAACKLTYEYLFGACPMIIEYLSAYDVWDKSIFDWEDVMNVQYAMRAEIGLNVYKMQNFIENIDFDDEIGQLSELNAKGKAIRDFLAVKNQGEVGNYSFIGKIDGEKALFMNTLESGSTTFQSKTPDWLDKEEIKLLAPFAVQSNGLVRFSLYETGGKFNVDCCEMAKRFGGGGHKGAAGFQIKVDDERFAEFLKTHEISSNEQISEEKEEEEKEEEKSESDRKAEEIRLLGFRSKYITAEDYVELADRFVHVIGPDKLRLSTIYDDTLRILSLTDANLKEAFFNGECMGDAFFGITFEPANHNGKAIHFDNYYPGAFNMPGNNNVKKRTLLICGIQYTNGCLIYTGDPKDYMRITQEGKD